MLQHKRVRCALRLRKCCRKRQVRLQLHCLRLIGGLIHSPVLPLVAGVVDAAVAVVVQVVAEVARRMQCRSRLYRVRARHSAA